VISPEFVFHLLHAIRTRILCEAEDVPVDLLSDVRIKLGQKMLWLT
jgi:hypothetical protein